MADKAELVALADLSKRLVIPTAVKRPCAFISAGVGRRDLALVVQRFIGVGGSKLSLNRAEKTFRFLFGSLAAEAGS